MLSKISIALSSLTLVLVVWFLAEHQEKKIAFANTEKLVYSFKGMQQAHDAYNLKQQLLKGDLEKINMEFKALVNDFRKNEKTLSENEKQKQIQAIQLKEAELKSFDEKMKEELQKLDEKATGGVLNQVDALVKKYAEEEGYDLVLGGNKGNVLHGDEVLDITEYLIKYINENHEVH